ncbi:MAG TPA: GTPase HflX [Ruminococcaceae bacterium]|jgi:GTP-binding protein HflX|nr:GTPase HflX [Oscillospiraceae bacterium]HCO37188.1 GTPase HflX [Oscillospiraceae bacterium]
MTQNYNEENKERAFLISLDCGEYDAESSMAELEELAKTSGAEIIGEMIQKRPAPEAATYMGKGALEEICNFCSNHNIDLIIADGELSPVQIRNIEDLTGVRVIDRTTLILDIFAGRARSSEGKLQVELAQLKYSLPRLSGKGTALSRLGGGIGTRGPGETKLETDRRHIRFRIQNLKAELDKVEKRRVAMHQRRKKNGALCVAIVGYTNAGKSTLMNRLTDAGVLQEDKLFATLDPTARKLVLPDGRQIMLVDTVGLVRRLPHQLVDAFRSTLEEAVWADVILNVCDASSDECAEHIRVTESVLSDLGCSGKPIINVLNKCDKPTELDFDFFENSVKISAATGDGIDSLLTAIENALPKDRKRVKILLPFDKMKLSSLVRDGTVHSEEYTENGVLYDATVNISDIKQLKDYII